MEEQNGTVNGVKIKLEEEETNDDLRTTPDHQNDAGASQPLTGDGASPGYFFLLFCPLRSRLYPFSFI